jgi:hypothetical protein
MMWLTRKEEGGGWSALVLTGAFFDIEGLPGRMRAVLEDPDFSDRALRRLFPSTYRNNPAAEAECQRLLRDDLLRHKRECLAAFERTVQAGTEIQGSSGFSFLQMDLSDEDLALWLGFLHDLRIVIGTALDIRDDDWNERVTPDDPHYQEFALLEGLAHLEQTILDALRTAEGFD